MNWGIFISLNCRGWLWPMMMALLLFRIESTIFHFDLSHCSLTFAWLDDTLWFSLDFYLVFNPYRVSMWRWCTREMDSRNRSIFDHDYCVGRAEGAKKHAALVIVTIRLKSHHCVLDVCAFSFLSPSREKSEWNVSTKSVFTSSRAECALLGGVRDILGYLSLLFLTSDILQQG